MTFQASITEQCVPALVVSIVSHGHGPMILQLLGDLAREHQASYRIGRVVLTQNIPEACPPLDEWPFVLELVQNVAPRGFGANHNHALVDATEELVCVLNPDVRLSVEASVFEKLTQAAREEPVGIAYPRQVDETGVAQDFERTLPTPWGLLRRHLRLDQTKDADWVNAACLVARRKIWTQLGGFDERYFMYCEDVDLSLRVRLAGLLLKRVDAAVLHTGQRASRKSFRHFCWHLASLFRLWCSPNFYRACLLLQRSSCDATRIHPE